MFIYRFGFRMTSMIGIALLAAGCATVGKSFQFAGPQSIVVGKTTRADVLSHYGEPFRAGYESGHLKWTYGYYKYRLFGDSETKDLAITFDDKGVVSDYDYSSSNPDEVKQATKK